VISRDDPLTQKCCGNGLGTLRNIVETCCSCTYGTGCCPEDTSCCDGLTCYDRCSLSILEPGIFLDCEVFFPCAFEFTTFFLYPIPLSSKKSIISEGHNKKNIYGKSEA
jgi:hypothetical protein